MDRSDRLARLAEFIVENGSVHVDQVCEHFDVSAATARRDLDLLAEQQLVMRTRGGAMVNPGSGDLPLRYRTVRASREKQRIALAAAGLVVPGQVIAFNGGTTTTSAAYEVGVRAAGDQLFRDAGTTVVTNAVNIANDLMVRPQLRVVVTGGVARQQSYELIGPLAPQLLPEISIDTLFLGVSAIDPERGLFAFHEGEAAINAAMVSWARRTVVLADSSKLQATAFARICGLGDIHAVITDGEIADASVASLERAGLEVTVV
ncbi:MAG: DeoR/GlpR family DNA-binding transcription regulator [Microbacterium sp.]